MSLRIRPASLTLPLLCVAMLCLFAAAVAARQGEAAREPVFHDFKGVRLGMTPQEARQKLGEPTEKGDTLDLYSSDEKQTVQIFYEGDKVAAIAVIYMKPGTDTLTPKQVLGSDIETKPDGSMYKMVRYPKAGYWVSYSRTGGDSPLVTVTMRKF